jgi:hypothetical protein
MSEDIDSRFFGHLHKEGVTDTTRFYDALYKIVEMLNFYKNNTNIDLSQALASHVAYSYYDCMSGAMPFWEIFVVRHLCKTRDIDLNIEVYPNSGSEKWYTLADFMKSSDEYITGKYLDLEKKFAEKPELLKISNGVTI